MTGLQESQNSSRLTNYLMVIFQALLFIFSVYLQKKTRKMMGWGKQYKQISRISFVSVLTLILILYNHENYCKPYSINLYDCLYLEFNWKQCLNVIILNSVLFAYHIYDCYESSSLFEPFMKQNWIRSIIFAPLLQQILFRAVFYRSSEGTASYVFIAFIFSDIAHLHKPIRKHRKGRKIRIESIISHLVITFIMGLYSAYFLAYYNSIIPCIILHAYCNYLGPPMVRNKKDLTMHGVCLFGFITYMKYLI